MTLLEKAKKVNFAKVNYTGNKELVALCVAWAKNEVRLSAVSKTLDVSPATAYRQLAQGLREYIVTKEK